MRFRGKAATRPGGQRTAGSGGRHRPAVERERRRPVLTCPTNIGGQLCSDCGRSLWRGELTLTATKPPVGQTADDVVNVSEAMDSGHLYAINEPRP
jgi:hypothetical protein